MNELDLVSTLGLLYEGVLSPERWQSALEKLAALTSSQAASLVLWSRQSNQAVVGDQVGLPEGLTQAYAAHYHLLDPARDHVDRVATGDWYLDERELGATSMRRLPFYQDFLRPYDLHSTMASPFLRSSGGIDGFLSLSSAPGRRDLVATARSLAPVMPHLQRAVALRMKLRELAEQSELQESVLDRLNFPLVIATPERRVVLANRLGALWLREDGNPMASGSRQSPAVTAILKAACAPAGERRSAGARIRRPSNTEYDLTAVPLPTRAAAGLASSPLALLLVSDPGRARPRPGDLLKQVFHLTVAEIRLLGPLQQGASVKEACIQLGISQHTARTQLQSIFGKLAIKRQSDISRVLGHLDIVDHSAT